ncbi:MAG TPA: TerC family protein [Symbiobacteriaceae bacterium]|nr:TerC family protein [Symbiobacteriaceae bacterium]
MFTGITLGAVFQIILIDLVLSGDNAVVIAMAARSLPEAQQKRAILFGGAAAIGLRVVITAVVALALKVPLLQLGGGLLLCWVAWKLLTGGEEEATDIKAANRLRDAVLTIVMADFVMSLDNMLAVGGASHGSLPLLLMGLLVSMGVIMFASTYIAKAMNRLPWLVYVGAGILAWTAGGMIMEDRWLHRVYAPGHSATLAAQAILTATVLVSGYLLNRRQEGQA